MNKTAIVTGGTKGIGAATAILLARKGSDVVISARHGGEHVQQVIHAVEQVGRRCLFVEADMAKPESSTLVVDTAVRELGGVDVLFHNAGGPVPGNILEIEPETWYRAFDVHVHAAFHLVRAVIPQMQQRDEGSIMLMSSIAAHRGVPNITTYATVKATMLQFARSLARDFADDNIRVNSICPGFVLTDFHSYLTPELEKHNLENRLPLHRFGTPDQIADAVVMMIANDFVNGETMIVDGGMTMQMVR